MLNNFLYFSVPWDSWDDDVSCEWPHLCKKKFTLWTMLLKKNRENIEKLNEQKYWVLCNIEPVLLSD